MQILEIHQLEWRYKQNSGNKMMDNQTKVSKLLSDLRSDDGQLINKSIVAIRDVTDTDEKNELFDALIKLLRDTNPWFRLRAVRALGTLGDRRAIDLLIETLDDDDGADAGQQMIEARFMALVSFKNSKAIQPLIEHIHRIDYKTAWAIGAFGDDVIDPMIDVLKHPKTYTRWLAAYWLGSNPNERAVQPLIAATNDPSERVRLQAIYSLGWIGSSEAITPLATLVHENDPKIRKAVADALGRIHNPQVLAFLQQLANDDELDVRTEALKSIEELQKGD